MYTRPKEFGVCLPGCDGNLESAGLGLFCGGVADFQCVLPGLRKRHCTEASPMRAQVRREVFCGDELTIHPLSHILEKISPHGPAGPITGENL